MTASVELPDDTTEVASIHITVGLAAKGTNVTYAYEGMDAETASGYIGVVKRRLEREADAKWADGSLDDWEGAAEIAGFHFVCPECEEHVDLDVEDVETFITDDDEDEDD